MCVIFFSYNEHNNCPLILAANRDEFYERPTAPAAYWEDFPTVYAGRDLVSNGTWLGITDSGRFAAVTNYRDPASPKGTRSRGDLVADFLKTKTPAGVYLEKLALEADQFSGFNLLAGEINQTTNELFHFSNRENAVSKLEPGVYGLSNHLLDTPWPKLKNGKQRFEKIISEGLEKEELFELLGDKTQAIDSEMPDTGVGLEIERVLSSIFIETPIYGTRCSSVVTIDDEFKASLEERTLV